jgi:hypothetical protein
MIENDSVKLDNWWGLGEEETTHFKPMRAFDYMRSISIDAYKQTPWLFAIWITEDANKVTVHREVMTILDVLSQIGGLLNFLLVGIGLLLFPI